MKTENNQTFDSDVSSIVDRMIAVSKYAPLGRTDFFVELLKSFKKEKPEIIAKAEEKKYRMQEIPSLTYRLVNSWQENGLLDDDKERGKGWRSFSLVDTAWLSIIKTLREFGVGIKDLQKIKAKMSSTLISKPFNYKMTWLEYAVYRAILDEDYPVYMIVFKDGGFEILCKYDYDLVLGLSEFPKQHIRIDLNDLFKETFKDEKTFQVRKLISQSISDEEYVIVRHLREKDPDTMVVERRRTPATPNFKKRVKNTYNLSLEEMSKPLKKLASEMQFGEMNLKIQDGKVVHCRVEVAEKINK